ncbi:hypothetical protein JCGZ_07999 [Jatropha curcas]|uniref:UVR domain-containing protein n=1 Tax=Jatropha curcas TaxID=180498 RepID=A0A067KP24_JATCU|nr:myosin heavy chain, non-muscle [Jatropha curcas]KDP36708.1 hypothetical protein JCGZ_07999 [Jatropha curcas]
MEEDDMDSLFEGMVLFTPSQLVDDQKKQQQQEKDDDHHHNNDSAEISLPPRESESRLDAATATIKTDPPSQHKVQEPLDENLFSDLTLQTLTTESDSLPTAATLQTATNSRQISRKKKKAASLRIGYGRGGSSIDDLPASPSEDQNLSLKDDDSTASNDIIHDDDKSDLDASQSQSPTSTSLVAELDVSACSIPDSQSLSKDDEYELIKAQISEKLHRSRQLAASVSSARKDAIRRRRAATEDLNSASAKHRDLELQLEAACEAEDFEAAERISDRLATTDKERQALLSALRDAEAHCDAIDSKMHDVLNSQILAEQECATVLSNFAKDAEKNADLVSEKAQVLSSKEMDEWFLSSEALEAKKMELDVELHFINEARLAVNDSIEHSIEDYRKEQERLHEKKDVLTDELQKLLALVKDKEKEIAENDSKIKTIEERIADVVSGFQDSQSSIEAKYDNLQLELSQIHFHSEALSIKKKEIDKLLAEGEDLGANLKELARVSEDEAKAYQEVVELRKRLMLSILNSREDKVRLAKAEEKLIEDVRMLQQDVSSLRASLQELSSTKSNIQQSIASFKQRIFFIDKRVPELESEKKVAASTRNFKEAARIAAEAKSLYVEKDGVQIDLERTTAELEKLEEDMKNTVSRLLDTEHLISSKEKEVAMARFQRLLLIAGAATAERVSALELGDSEEANLLLAEAEAANAEAKKLQPIYNFNKEQFPNLPKHFISMELVFNLGRKQLADLAASVGISAPQ